MRVCRVQGCWFESGWVCPFLQLSIHLPRLTKTILAQEKVVFSQKPEKSLIQMKNWKISTWFGKSRGIEKNPRLCPKVALTRNMP